MTRLDFLMFFFQESYKLTAHIFKLRFFVFVVVVVVTHLSWDSLSIIFKWKTKLN